MLNMNTNPSCSSRVLDLHLATPAIDGEGAPAKWEAAPADGVDTVDALTLTDNSALH